MAKGTGKPCGASYISHNKFCRVGLPTHVNEALNRASHEVGIVELINAAKYAGGKGALGKAVAIRQQLRQEVAGAGNLKKGEHGRELKRRLEAAGLLPQKAAKSENAGDIFAKNVKPAPEAPKTLPTDLKKGLAALPLPSNLKKELAALAARDQQAENPKAPSAKPDELYGAWPTADLERHRDFLLSKAGDNTILRKADAELARRANNGKPAKSDSFDKKLEDDLSRFMRGSVPTRLEIASAGDEGGIRVRVKGERKSGTASTNSQWAKEEAQDFDKSFKPATRTGGTYDWNETSKSGTKKIGEGSFGTVLMTKGPPPVAVKRGEISRKEATLIDKVGKADLGPKLIAADLAKGGREEYGVQLGKGRIAMSVVPGKPLMDMMNDTKVGNTTAGDAYWKARGDLHRLGIAHNDAHPGNLLIDEKGKGRWVDMGLAHDHPGAALAEALGALRKPAGAVGVGGGDWQGQGWASKTGNSDGRVTSFAGRNLKRMQKNLDTKVLPFLRSKGLTDDEIGTVMTNGIRRPPTEYTTMKGFAKLNDNDALKAIDLLYTGIK